MRVPDRRCQKGSEHSVRRPGTMRGSPRKLEMTESKFKPIAEQIAYLKKGVAEIIREEDLTAKLEQSGKTGKPLCGHYRLARMLEREDFRSRLDNHQPISVHELLYPLLTAYDAVALQSDVEIGATEQKFNLLVHRDIQREYGLASEVALTMPILVGLGG